MNDKAFDLMRCMASETVYYAACDNIDCPELDHEIRLFCNLPRNHAGKHYGAFKCDFGHDAGYSWEKVTQ